MSVSVVLYVVRRLAPAMVTIDREEEMQLHLTTIRQEATEVQLHLTTIRQEATEMQLHLTTIKQEATEVQLHLTTINKRNPQRCSCT